MELAESSKRRPGSVLCPIDRSIGDEHLIALRQASKTKIPGDLS